MGTLTGKSVIVTGAGKGLGAAYAIAAAAHGASVAVLDVISLDETVEKIRAAGGQAFGSKCDISDRKAVEKFVEKTDSTFGGVHGLVNNAALFAELKVEAMESISSDDFNRILAVNVTGTFECLRAVLPVMRRQKYGKIINVTSSTIFLGTPQMLAYVSSKGAVLAMTRAAARELGDDGIRVNALSPGLTQSDGTMEHPWQLALKDKAVAAQCLKRLEQPEDLTGTVTFLLSPDSDFITGQVVVVDGGGIMP